MIQSRSVQTVALWGLPLPLERLWRLHHTSRERRLTSTEYYGLNLHHPNANLSAKFVQISPTLKEGRDRQNKNKLQIDDEISTLTSLY